MEEEEKKQVIRVILISVRTDRVCERGEMCTYLRWLGGFFGVCAMFFLHDFCDCGFLGWREIVIHCLSEISLGELLLLRSHSIWSIR